jgi:hypothetical protein
VSIRDPEQLRADIGRWAREIRTWRAEGLWASISNRCMSSGLTRASSAWRSACASGLAELVQRAEEHTEVCR